MAISHQIVTLEGNAALVSPAGNHAGRDITIQNLSGVNVYLGSETVDSSDFGYRLAPGSAWSVELRAGEHLYAYADTTANVAVLACGLED